MSAVDTAVSRDAFNEVQVALVRGLVGTLTRTAERNRTEGEAMAKVVDDERDPFVKWYEGRASAFEQAAEWLAQRLDIGEDSRPDAGQPS